MATIEFMQNRIEGYKKALEKSEKKLARILKAEESNWENNPYYYDESDKRRTLREIEETEQKLADMEDQLAKALEKENSRNVQVILDFLDDWERRVYTYYIDTLPQFIDEREEYLAEERAYYDRLDNLWKEIDNYDERRKVENELYRKRGERRKQFTAKWKWIMDYLTDSRSNELNLEKLQKDLDNEAKAKYDDIIERTNAIVGTITDASNLEIGMKGDLNGYIIGDRGTAKVTTIGAGGYNIQCYHFRTLIKKIG